jgi:hypothetical protein
MDPIYVEKYVDVQGHHVPDHSSHKQMVAANEFWVVTKWI